MAAALACEVLLAYWGLSSLVPHKEQDATEQSPQRVPVQLSLAADEELVPLDQPAPTPSATVAPVADVVNLSVQVSATVSDEAGASAQLTVLPSTCSTPERFPLHAFTARSNVSEMSVGLNRVFCIAVRQPAAGPAYEIKSLTGSWGSVATEDVPEFDSKVMSLTFVSPQGVARRLSLVAVGYCESAGEGCSASIALEEASINEHPSSRVHLGRFGMSPIWLSAGGG